MIPMGGQECPPQAFCMLLMQEVYHSLFLYAVDGASGEDP
jgi:hypothetical protein